MDILRSELLEKIDFIEHGFFNRNGGESDGSFASLNVGFHQGDNEETVFRNCEKIAENFGVSISNFVMLKQIHSDVAHVITSENIEKYNFLSISQALSNEGDAIITDQKGLLIGVNSADCAPILLCDTEARIIAAIHAGWRGAIGNIIEKTMKKMCEMDCKSIFAAIGPCVQKNSLVIESDVAKKIDRKYLSFSDSKIFFDMQFLILDKLMKCGAKTVSKINIDTFTNEDYFSYRRQHGMCGDQFSGIMIKE